MRFLCVIFICKKQKILAKNYSMVPFERGSLSLVRLNFSKSPNQINASV